MIIYTLKIDNEVTTLECETMEQLIQYLKADKSEVVNVSSDKGMTATEVLERRSDHANTVKG